MKRKAIREAVSFARFGALIAAALMVAPVVLAQNSVSGFIQAGGVRLHTLSAGPASSAHTLVLIPGWSTDAAIWQEQIAHFSPHMRVVAFDPRSQGASGKTADGNTPQQRARDYAAAFARLGLRHIVLVGWSQGVQDVAAYIRQFGARRLSGVVLVDAAVSRGSSRVMSDPKSVRALLGEIDLYARQKRDYLEGMMHVIFARGLPEKQFNALVETGMKTPTNSGVAMLVAEMLGADLTPALKKFGKPVLIVASARSPELAAQKAEAAALPHAKFVVIRKAGHAVFVDRPKAFDRALGEFIASLGKG